MTSMSSYCCVGFSMAVCSSVHTDYDFEALTIHVSTVNCRTVVID